MFSLETPGPWNPEQNVHSDWIPLLAGEEGAGNDLLAEVLLSVHPREQVERGRRRETTVSQGAFTCRTFCMIPYNQTTSKITNTESFRLKSCVRRPAESIDKRFCFDIIPEEKPSVTYTLQAQSEEDRGLWLEALDGTEPPYAHTPGGKLSKANQTFLDESGFHFIQVRETPASQPASVSSLRNSFCLRTVSRPWSPGVWRTRACTGWSGWPARSPS